MEDDSQKLFWRTFFTDEEFNHSVDRVELIRARLEALAGAIQRERRGRPIPDNHALRLEVAVSVVPFLDD